MEAPLNQPLMAASDPFYAVRDALEAEVQGVKIKHDQWKQQLHAVNSATDAQFRVRHEAHKKDLAKAGELCRKVRMAVDNVDQNRSKYPHIDDRELGARKGFCERVDAAVSAMRTDFASRETQGKVSQRPDMPLSRRRRCGEGRAQQMHAQREARTTSVRREEGGIVARGRVRSHSDLVLFRFLLFP